jgi:hypothetical protein
MFVPEYEPLLLGTLYDVKSLVRLMFRTWTQSETNISHIRY